MAQSSSPQQRELLAAEDGYTLFEISVAVTISFILIGLVGGTYLLLRRGTVQWEDQLAMENEIHLIVDRVVEDMLAADAVHVEGDSLWMVKGQNAWGEADSTAYTIRSKMLHRGSQVMHHRDRNIVEFDISSAEVSSSELGSTHPVEDYRTGESKGNSKLYKVSVALQDRSKTIELSTMVQLRQAERWLSRERVQQDTGL